MHCFSGDAAFARRCADLGFIASFSGIVTFPRSDDIQEAARTVADDGYVVETDSPFLSPVPERGKPNLPERVAITAAAVARLRGAPVEEPCAPPPPRPPIASSDSPCPARPRRVTDDARAERGRHPLDLTDPRTLTAVGRRVGLRRDTNLGQHFLIDRDVLDAIVDALDPGTGQRGARDRLRARDPHRRARGARAPRGRDRHRPGVRRGYRDHPARRMPTSPCSRRMRASSIRRPSASPPGGWPPATFRTSSPDSC